jgi:integrase
MTGFTSLTVRVEWQHIDLAKFQHSGHTAEFMGIRILRCFTKWYRRGPCQAHNLKVVGSNPTPATSFWTPQSGEVLLVSSILVREVARVAGLEHLAIHPHMLRHSCGYSLVNRGIDIRSIQGYLGHRSITSTTRYTALDSRRFAKFF